MTYAACLSSHNERTNELFHSPFVSGGVITKRTEEEEEEEETF